MPDLEFWSRTKHVVWISSWDRDCQLVPKLEGGPEEAYLIQLLYALICLRLLLSTAVIPGPNKNI